MDLSFARPTYRPPNDPKLSDRGVRRGTCMAGGKAAAEAGAVTHGAVRCSAWLGDGCFCFDVIGEKPCLPLGDSLPLGVE